MRAFSLAAVTILAAITTTAAARRLIRQLGQTPPVPGQAPGRGGNLPTLNNPTATNNPFPLPIPAKDGVIMVKFGQWSSRPFPISERKRRA